MELDKSRSYGTTFGPDAAEMPYIQNGFYFDAKGKLVDCDYNAKRAKEVVTLDSLDVKPDEPVSPVVEKLKDRTVSEVFAMAVRLQQRLKDEGVESTFEPSATDKEANIRFIAKYAQ